MWFLYECLLSIAFFLYLPKAVWRKRLPHRGWSMRLGRYPASATQALKGRSALWVHAVSVGEVLAARPLLQQLTQTDTTHPLVLSTITSGGFEMATAQLKDRGVAIYLPLDLRGCVRRALNLLQPQMLLLVESELWPLLIHEAHARRIPIAVVNGRISARAFRRYLWFKPWLTRLLRHIDLFLMQSQTDADHILAMGAPPERVHVVGSLKWDASIGSRPAPSAIRETATRLGLSDSDIVIVAGSTHRGEEEAVLRAFQQLRQAHPRARLIIAPRHLERLAEVEGLLRHHGFTPVRFSQLSTTTWDVGLVDTFGQLPIYYGVATVVFIGGSLIPHGGQNPLEATSLGKPVVFGPSMHNFEAIAHQLLAHHAARQVASADELIHLLSELVTDHAEAEAMGHRAQEVTERFQGATSRTLEALRPLLIRTNYTPT